MSTAVSTICEELWMSLRNNRNNASKLLEGFIRRRP